MDDFDRKVWLYLTKAKSDVFVVFKEFKTLVEKQPEMYTKVLRTNYEGEYKSNDCEGFYKENDIVH